jgi:menaquinone-dependent protoporphyrinogen oxidase
MRGETHEIADLRYAIRPEDHRNFAGSIAKSDWPAFGRIVFRLMRGRYGDYRNWLAIDDWGVDIAATLTSSSSVRPEDRRR